MLTSQQWYTLCWGGFDIEPLPRVMTLQEAEYLLPWCPAAEWGMKHLHPRDQAVCIASPKEISAAGESIFPLDD